MIGVDKEHLDTAHILSQDGFVDDREVDLQIAFFRIDEQFGRLCEQSPKWSVNNVIWRLHGGSRAKAWLYKLKRDMT